MGGALVEDPRRVRRGARHKWQERPPTISKTSNSGTSVEALEDTESR
jgi:hypothetical protein